MNTKYQGKDNYGQPKQKYLDKLSGLTDEKLQAECEQMIWLSAYASNNRRSDYHWQVDACYDECERRKKPEIYKKGYEEAKASCS